MFLKFGLPIAAVLLFAMAVYHVIHTFPTEPSVAPPLAPNQSPFPQALAVTGIVEPKNNYTSVAAPMPGVVTQVLVQVGEHVTAGKPLFRLDDRSLRAEVQVYEARLGTAKAQLAKLEHLPRAEDVAASAARVGEAKANLLMHQARLERGQLLLKDKLASPQEVEQLHQAVVAAQEQLTRVLAEDRSLRGGAWEADKAVARAGVAEAEALVHRGITELNHLTVCAPADGAVLQVNVREGEAVGARPELPPVVLGDIKFLHLRVEVPQERIAVWHAQALARAMPRGQQLPVVALRFVRVEPMVVMRKVLSGDPSERSDTRVLQVIYEFDPPQGSVYVGQQMDVFIATDEASKRNP